MALRLRLLLLLLAVASVATPSAVATADPDVQDAAGLWASAPTCDGLAGECVDEDDEPDMEPEDARRFLYRAHGRQRFISYGALSRDRVPCNRRGHSYYNCRRSGRANPYRRGCSVITRCARYLD
ncbi:Rapid ALkalinization Factor (RALF) [Musa troglodytarum]|uniref:Rapid ALkalinization Factor (RALF) n=1 Tax=Musa troglodytarum TaxID=320322 RepID=A0A9E7GPJ0_9LILI|nr:Rapid ALkalinization Factor (RALF) [Musa troglodytarum]